MLDLTTSRWERRADYPFLVHAQFTTINCFTFLGGHCWQCRRYLSRIAAYNPASDQWSDKGRLLTARDYAGVIWDQSGFVVVGGWIDGYGSVKSEKCQFNGDKLKCSYYGPSIDQCK